MKIYFIQKNLQDDLVIRYLELLDLKKKSKTFLGYLLESFLEDNVLHLEKEKIHATNNIYSLNNEYML